MDKISIKCPKCIEGIEKVHAAGPDGGTFSDITCRTCYGTALVPGLVLDKDLIDFLNDLKDTVDAIKEKVDES